MRTTRAQIEEKLKNILVTIIDVEPEALKPDADLIEDLGIDSIKTIEMVIAIDKHFKLSLDKDIRQLKTLSEIADTIFDILDKE